MRRSTIASLAILKVNYETRGLDYIDNFVPFVVECVKTSADDVVSLPVLQRDLHNRFGLLLPLNPLRQILQRAARDGFLRRDSGVFYRNVAACAGTSFADTQQQVAVTEVRVIAALQEFARQHHSLELTDEESEEALLSFIGDSGLDILFAAAEGSVLPQPKPRKDARFAVASFINDCRTSHPGLFQDIETIIKGALLANALYIPNPERITQPFQNTRVYFDTSFLVFAVGYAGADRQAPCAELLELLKAYGADLRCFRQTVEEARGILDACAARIRRGELRTAFGPTIEYFIAQGLTSTDVDLLAARFHARLALLGVQVDDKPPYEKEFVIDEHGFEQRLKEKVGYANPRALLHDVDCVSAIARFRGGRESFAVETCSAIFVTTNSELARTTRGFFQPESTPGAVALCITDYAIGNLLWLKNPTKAPELPKRRLIADAYAAMEPTEPLWKDYLTEIARLEASGEVTAEDYMLLRHSVSAKAALMDLTKGDVAAFTQGSVAEILEVAKRNLRADLQSEITAERNQRIATESALARKEAVDAERLLTIRSLSSAFARWIGRVCFVIAMLSLGIATLYTFPWQLPSLSQGLLRYLLATFQALLFVYVLASMGWGTTIQKLAARLEQAVAASLERRLRAWLQI